ISQNNWNGGVQCDSLDVVRMNTEISIENNIKTQSADEAYVSVLKSAGASFFRDSVDERIINDVRSGTTSVGNGIIDSQEDVGGWPQLQSKETPKDTDGDGMPDVWEKAAALDINKDDSALYSLSKVYTNIEVYINSLVESLRLTSIINGERYHYVVAKDGTGDFNSVQDAINAVPNFRQEQTKIFIKNGVYYEKLTLSSSKTNVTFVGESTKETR